MTPSATGIRDGFEGAVLILEGNDILPNIFPFGSNYIRLSVLLTSSS